MARTSSPSASMSALVAPPRFSRKLQCFSDTWALPRRRPRQPAASSSAQALWPGGLAKVDPPLRARTGGSTFANPPGHKAWALLDAAGCRGRRRGNAQVSEKHCNFLLNLGGATSADIEALGEEVRAIVRDHSGITLRWEIERVGV